MKRYLTFILFFISLISFGQEYNTLFKNGRVVMLNGVRGTTPSEVVNITYNWNDNDTSLFLLTSAIKNTDTLDASAGIFTTYIKRNDGAFTVHADSGLRGYQTSLYELIDTKENKASHFQFEPFGHYKISWKMFLKDSFNLSTNRIIDMGGTGFFDVNTAGNTDNRFNTDRVVRSHLRAEGFTAGSWIDYYHDRDFETGEWYVDGFLYSDAPDTGMTPYNSLVTYFMNRGSKSYPFLGWLDSFKIVSLGETSTVLYNVKSDSSTIYLNPTKFESNVTLSHPLSDVAKFTGGSNNGLLNACYVDVDTRFPSDYKSLSPECAWADIKIEGSNSYARFAIYDRGALLGWTDTIKNVPNWDYYQINLDNTAFGKSEKKYAAYFPYPKPMPNKRLTFKLVMFIAEGESISLRNFGLRYKSDAAAHTTEYNAGSYTTVNLSTPLITFSVIGDVQPDDASQYVAYVIPPLDTASQHSDVAILVGDLTDRDTTMHDSVANGLLTYFGLGNYFTTPGNHDTYEDARLALDGKHSYLRLLGLIGESSRVDTVSGNRVVRQVKDFGNNIYWISYDNLVDDCNDCGTYTNGTPIAWAVGVVDSIYSANPSSIVFCNTHFPKALHEASSITSGGESYVNVDSLRSVLSTKPNFAGFVGGHRHYSDLSIEENGIAHMMVPSMNKTTTRPIFIGYIEVFENYVRWSYKNHNNADMAEVSGGQASFYAAGFISNYFGYYYDWMFYVQPRTRDIYDYSIGRIRDKY